MISDPIGSGVNIESALHGLRQPQQQESAAASVLTQTQPTSSAPEQKAAQPQQVVRNSDNASDGGHQGQPGRGENLDLEA